MNNDAREIVAGVLQVLAHNDVPLQKIVLHKFMYFLTTQGVPTGLRFEPYTYGPFSFDLAKTLGSMAFWDEIVEGKNAIEIKQLDEYPDLPPALESKIKELLHAFLTVVGELSFRNLECAGTALYCADTLAAQGSKITKESVKEEFKAWKGERYTDEEIYSMFKRIKPYLSVKRN